MTSHKTGSRDEWLAARLDLLGAEKELTRRSDEVARQRQELPWVPVDKDYVFDTDEGTASLADLFRGRSQLLIYHFMFGPGYEGGCPSCSAITTSPSTRCHARRWRNCRPTRSGWAGASPGRPRQTATSTTTSTSRIRTTSGSPEPSSTTSAPSTSGCRRLTRIPSSPRSRPASERTGRPTARKGPA